MPKFNVSCLKVYCCTADVEANTKEEAIDKIKNDVTLLDEQFSDYDYWEANTNEDKE